MSDKSKPLKGQLFCVTVNNNTREGDSNATSLADDVSYNEMKRMIGELGGKISGTVHKRVDFLVASENAVLRVTQRVRKANKYSVPVVRMALVDYCYTNRTMPTDMSAFVFPNVAELCLKFATTAAQEEPDDEQQKATGSTKKKRKAIEAATSGNVARYEPFEFKVAGVFECACICHDRGETSCSWCEGAHMEHNTAHQYKVKDATDYHRDDAVDDANHDSKNKRHRKDKRDKKKKI